MALNRTQARQLLTIPEFELFTQSRTDGLRHLTPAQLRSKIERTRALRDKFRDLYRRQAVATRADAAASNERTQRKAEVFEDILHRFENHLQEMDDDEAPRDRRPAARRAAPRPGAYGATARAPVRERAAPARDGGAVQGGAGAAAPARRRSAAAGTAGRPAPQGDRPPRASAQPRTAATAKPRAPRNAPARGAAPAARRASGRTGGPPAALSSRGATR
jgi:hypothetical protein